MYFFSQIIFWNSNNKKCDAMVQGLIGFIWNYCQQRITPLPGSLFGRNEEVKRVGMEVV
jgi:hypothetical protein